MVGTSWSSASSWTSSLNSLDDDDVVCIVKPPDDDGAAFANTAAASVVVKFLCSYGGRILPRHTDGALRYVGGDNRVLSVHRSIQFHELLRKLRDLCGRDDVCLRCQLPTEDLDALVAVTSDDDLANLLEEYDAAGKDSRLQPLKIRAFLFPRTTATLTKSSSHPPRRCSPSPPPTSMSSNKPPSNAQLRRQNSSPAGASRASPTCAPRWWEAQAPLLASRLLARADLKPPPPQHYGRHGEARPPPPPHRYLVHSGSHWQ